MKILIDTNIILDVLFARKEYLYDGEKIFKLCEIKKIDGYISALSVPNIIYIMRKELTKEKTADILSVLLKIFTAVDLRSDDLKKAAALNFADYEDALQAAAAVRIGADYIVTRNVKDFAESKVKAVLPKELFEKL